MDILMEYLPLLIPIVIAVTVLSILSSRTKFALVFTLVQGIAVLFTFCFLMWAGASLEELLLVLAVMLLPSLLFNSRRGRDEE